VRYTLAMSSLRSGQICSDAVIRRLQVMGEIFANALLRKNNEESLRTAFAELKQLRDRLQSENLYLQETIQVRSAHGEIIGKSQAMQAVLRRVDQVAETDSTVLLQGETGTGKELIAHTIHRLSARNYRPMITVNCAALAPPLIESALFGHEKGSFTGALRKKAGYFEVADRSTIFLDEIGELSLELQAKLLRVLETRQFERIGGTQTITVDVRVIAATNQHLSSAVEQGDFRADLYYRLHVFPIHVPPLRDRPEDIPLLIWTFVRNFARSMNTPIERIPRNVMHALQHYPWPGNVRELRNVIEHAMIISQGSTLTLPSFEKQITEVSFSTDLSLDDIMKQHILAVLERTGWRVSGKQGAAEILGMKATTLEARMKKLGITRPA
jgi:transcriptional regulator with GAF, ATPase, and Fis domain